MREKCGFCIVTEQRHAGLRLIIGQEHVVFMVRSEVGQPTRQLNTWSDNSLTAHINRLVGWSENHKNTMIAQVSTYVTNSIVLRLVEHVKFEWRRCFSVRRLHFDIQSIGQKC